MSQRWTCTGRRPPTDRHAPSFLSARLPEGLERRGTTRTSSRVLPPMRTGRASGRSRRWTRTASAPPCCRCRRRRACGSTPAPRGRPHRAHLQRLRRGDGARFSRPVRSVCHAADGRHRHHAEGNRICVRHAESRRRRTADRATATSGSAIPFTARYSKNSTAARPWSTSIRSPAHAAPISVSA